MKCSKAADPSGIVVMKLLEQALDSFIRKMVNIDEMQFGFVPGRGTTDTIFIVRQLQKYIAAKKLFHFAFVDLAKALDRLPRKDLWWASRASGRGIGCVWHSGHVLQCP